jgi:hypothetical protein
MSVIGILQSRRAQAAEQGASLSILNAECHVLPLPRRRTLSAEDIRIG